MCCKSKAKPTTTVVQSTTVPVVTAGGVGPVYTSTAQVSNSRLPKSTISFTANDFQSSPLTNQQNFVITKRVPYTSEDKGDRLEDYAYEINHAKESKLLAPKQILNYDLDRGDGVSRTPIINTFHYQSQLSHCFLHHYNADHYNQRNSVYNNEPIYANNSTRTSNLNQAQSPYYSNVQRTQQNSGITNPALNNSGIRSSSANNSRTYA